MGNINTWSLGLTLIFFIVGDVLIYPLKTQVAELKKTQIKHFSFVHSLYFTNQTFMSFLAVIKLTQQIYYSWLHLYFGGKI